MKTTAKKQIARNLFQSTRMAKAEAEVAQIARELLDLDTLETRNSDSLDFHDTAVWSIKAALIAAYEAGRSSK